MSTFNGNNNPNPAGPVAAADRRRAASVTLRTDGDARAQSVADLMDPANKSLADALKIAYKLLQLAIVAIVVIYVASGVQKIEEGERGVGIVFGRIAKADLTPGPHFSWPAPVGEVIKVPTGAQRVDLKKEFFPNLTDNEEKILSDPGQGEQGLSGGGRTDLDPDSDGQLLTGDGSIVHARFFVTYKRDEASIGRWLRTIAEADTGSYEIEKQIVTAAARRGIVQAASRMTIDEVLYNQPEPWRKPGEFVPLADLARRSAQEFLDTLTVGDSDTPGAEAGSGIVVQDITMTHRIPPRMVMKSFTDVQSAQATASKEIQDAQSAARQKLTETAGDAAPVILSLIDRYDAEFTESRRPDADPSAQRAAEQTLQAIHDLMQRKAVEIDGKPVAATVSGRVSQTVSTAEQFRSSVVSRAQADAAVFRAKLEAYRSNPSVFLTSEWTEAMRSFLAQPSVQSIVLPPTLDRTVILINRDPEVAARQAQEALEKAAKAAEEIRRKDMLRSIHERTIKTTTE